jgi:hypothetical protein
VHSNQFSAYWKLGTRPPSPPLRADVVLGYDRLHKFDQVLTPRNAALIRSDIALNKGSRYPAFPEDVNEAHFKDVRDFAESVHLMIKLETFSLAFSDRSRPGERYWPQMAIYYMFNQLPPSVENQQGTLRPLRCLSKMGP